MKSEIQKSSETETLTTILESSSGDLQALAGRLHSAAKGRPLRTILVTSSNPGEGKTTVAAAMAHVLAETRRAPVLLIDGSQRAPSLHIVFKTTSAPGLREMMRGEATADRAIRNTQFANLRILTCGAGDLMAEALDVEKLRRVLQELHDPDGCIIVDGNSIMTSSETTLMAGLFDGIVIVVECEKTKGNVLQDAKARVEDAGGHVLGIILNRRRYYVPRGLYDWI